jgi:hypothetical protein
LGEIKNKELPGRGKCTGLQQLVFHRERGRCNRTGKWLRKEKVLPRLKMGMLTQQHKQTKPCREARLVVTGCKTERYYLHLHPVA